MPGSIVMRCRIRAATARGAPLVRERVELLDCPAVMRLRGAFDPFAEPRSSGNRFRSAGRSADVGSASGCVPNRHKENDRGVPPLHLSEYRPESSYWRRDGRAGTSRVLEIDPEARLSTL